MCLLQLSKLFCKLSHAIVIIHMSQTHDKEVKSLNFPIPSLHLTVRNTLSSTKCHIIAQPSDVGVFYGSLTAEG